MSPASLHFQHAVRSDRGAVRQDNQDAAYADGRVLAVADGMGGHPAGDVAASLMTRPFARLAVDDPSWDVVDHLRAAALAGDDAIAEHVAANPQRAGMGTTLTAMLLDGPRVGLLHVGDSRAYMLRERALSRLSRDDSLVQSLIDDGVLTEDEARSHPQRHVVLRALTGRIARFSLASFDVYDSDRLFLCSDGITDVVPDDVLAEALADQDPEQCAERLIALALERGSADNVTCIVADVVRTVAEGTPVCAGALASSR